MQCDLHFHTRHSGMCPVPGMRRLCLQNDSQPLEVCEKLKRQGMDLMTDQNSIGAVEELRRFADFFLSEEVTRRMPSGTELHVGVYDITEQDQSQMQRRRHDPESRAAYLDERRLLFSANRLFSSLTGRRRLADFECFDRLFPAMETTRNWLLPRTLNKRSGGRAFTQVSGMRGKCEALDGLRRGQGRILGGSGWWPLTQHVLLIAGGTLLEDRWKIVLAPLALGVPVVTAANSIMELAFAPWWFHQVRRARGRKSSTTPVEAVV